MSHTMLYFLMCHSKTVWKSESERCIRKLGLDWCGESSIKLSTSPCFLKQGFKKKRKPGLKTSLPGGPMNGHLVPTELIILLLISYKWLK